MKNLLPKSFIISFGETPIEFTLIRPKLPFKFKVLNMLKIFKRYQWQRKQRYHAEPMRYVSADLSFGAVYSDMFGMWRPITLQADGHTYAQDNNAWPLPEPAIRAAKYLLGDPASFDKAGFETTIKSILGENYGT